MNHHDFWWRFFPKRELNQIYLSVALRALSISLLGLFIPLYLHYEIGISLMQTLLFYVLYSTIFGIATPVAAKFASHFGVKHTILFSLPFYFMFIAGLYALPYYDVPLILIAVSSGISWAFYWLGLHLAFHHASHPKFRGEEIGKQKSATILATLLGPVLGGFLIVHFGFKLVFLLTAVLLLLATIILFASKENHIPYHFSIRAVINRKYWRNSFYYVSRGSMAMASSVVWPLCNA